MKDRIAKRAEEIQKTMYVILNGNLKKHPKSTASYQDSVNAYFINKLAQLEVALEDVLIVLKRNEL